MDQNKPIPGARPYKQQLAELRAELKKADEQIKDYERKIDEVKKNDAKNSPKAPLLIRRKELSLVIKELNGNKKECFDKMNQIKDTYGDVSKRQTDTKGFISTESIDKKLAEIKMEMIMRPYDAQQSKQIEDQMKDLRLKKMSIEAEKKKHEVLRQVQEQYRALNSTVSELFKELKEKNNEMTEIMNSIKEIESSEDTKNPAIEGFEKNIDSLKLKKEDINKKIAVNQEEIAKKREEHNAFLQKKAIEEAYEKRRSDILEKVKDLEVKKETMEEEINKCDASRFDSVIFYLEKKTGRPEEKITFPIDVIMSLTQFKVTIPSKISQIEETISQLNDKKKIFLEEVEIKRKNLKEEIENIAEKIQKEKILLADIPAAEVRLPPFSTKTRSK